MKARRYIVSGLSALAQVALFAFSLFTFGNRIVVNKEMLADKESFVERVDTNFIVYGLSEDQQTEYKALDGVDYLYSYYLYETNVSIKEGSYKTPVAIYTDGNDSKTPFCDARVLSKETKANPIYVDYYFASENKLFLNDSCKVKLGKSIVDMTVAGIYKTNYFGDSHVVVRYADFQEAIDKIFDKFSTNYSYIHASDATSFDNYLKENYIPKAFMKERSDFDNDIDYEIYVKSYESKEYYNASNVKLVSVEIDSSLASGSKQGLIFSIVILAMGIVVLDLIIALVYARLIKFVSLSSNDFKSYSLVHWIVAGISILLGVICFCLFASSLTSNAVSIDFANAISDLFPVFATFFIASLAGTFVKFLFTKGTLSSGKKKAGKDKESNK